MSNTELDFALPEGWHRKGWRILDAQEVPLVTINSGGNGDPPEWRESTARIVDAAPEMMQELERVESLFDKMGEDGYIARIEEGWLYDNHGNKVESVDSFLEGIVKVLTKIRRPSGD